MLELPIIIVALGILLIASFTDLKSLEVPDWLSYAGIGAGLLIHLVFSVQQWSYWPFLSSGIGLAIGFGLGALMFYTGQWGGGDAKLLMALGALIGFAPDKFSFGTSFLINLVVFGAIWSLLWSLGLAIMNAKRFARTFNAIKKHKPFFRIRMIALACTVLLLIASLAYPFVAIELVMLACISFFLAHLTIFLRSVELSCMHKWMSPDKLTEGDWLVHTVNVGSITIGPQKLGLDKESVAKLQDLHRSKKVGNVLVRYGVPFVPAFLFAFLATLAFNNILLELLVVIMNI